MPAYDTLDEALMREMIEPLVLSIALSRRVDQRQIPRLALRVGRLALAGEITLVERNRDFLGKSDANKAAGSDCVAVPDQQDGLFGRDDLAFLGAAQIWQSGVLVHGVAPEINANLRHLLAPLSSHSYPNVRPLCVKSMDPFADGCRFALLAQTKKQSTQPQFREDAR